MLLIVTNKDDFSADFLITKLLERDLPYYRLNSDDVGHTEINFRLEQEGVVRSLACGGRSVDLNEVRAVWYRRVVSPPEAELGRDLDQGKFISDELRHLLEGLILNQDVTWVNPMASAHLAERKVLQLRVAKRLGFRVSPTVISNDPEVLRSFAREHSSAGLICKPVFRGLYQDSTGSYAIFTRRLEAGELQDDQQLRTCPTLLQREVPKGHDIRVTVIGREVFSARLNYPAAPPIDWRTPDANVEYEALDLPADLESKCQALLNALGLRYGAFDFVQDPTGDFWFLEVNPTGEWAWLEKELAFPLRDAFIRLFGCWTAGSNE